MTEENFHAIPRLSASSLERLEKCPASFARDVEMHTFCTAHGIKGAGSSAVADAGSKLHALLALVPFRDEVLGVSSDGKPAPSRAEHLLSTIRRLAPVAGINNIETADLWFCYHAIKTRDRIISHVLGGNIPDIAKPLKKVQFNFDRVRMHVEFPPVVVGKGPVEFSGLPDVQVNILDAKDRYHAIIADYKSGYLDQTHGETNRQLTGLAALTGYKTFEGRPLSSVYVSTLSRAELCPPPEAGVASQPAIRIARYGPAEIDRAKIFTRNTVRDAARAALTLQGHFAAGGSGEIPLEVNEELHLKATVGSHCTYCNGKTCCTKMRETISEFHSRSVSPQVNEIKEAKNRLEANAMLPADLTTKVLSVTRPLLAETVLFEKVDAEATELVRQIKLAEQERAAAALAKGDPYTDELPGVKLKAGSRRLVVKAEPVAAAEGEEADPIPLGPAAVYARLEDLVAGVDLPTFVEMTCNVDPGFVRAFLADQHGIPEKAVYEKLLSQLSDNPFEMKPNRPTVILPPIQQAPVQGTPARPLPAYLEPSAAPQAQEPVAAMAV